MMGGMGKGIADIPAERVAEFEAASRRPLAQRWRLSLVPGQKVGVQPKITLRPKYAIRVVPELR